MRSREEYDDAVEYLQDRLRQRRHRRLLILVLNVSRSTAARRG